jgi:hypothetical protein
MWRAIIWNAVLILGLSVGMITATAAVFAGEIGDAIFDSPQPAHLVILTLIATSFSLVSMPLILRLEIEGQAKRFVALNLWSSLAGAALLRRRRQSKILQFLSRWILRATCMVGQWFSPQSFTV